MYNKAMAENQPLDAVQDRKIMWGLIATVFFFVLVMSGIVLWITTALIQNERGGSGQSDPSNPLGVETSIQPSLRPTDMLRGPLTRTVSGTRQSTPTRTPGGSQAPIPVDATWTPVPGSTGYVRFVYYFVNASKIVLGECVQITWETENAASLQLYRNGELILDNAPASLTIQDCPVQTGYTVYRLLGVNNRGQSNWIELQVKVQAAP